jgi:deazaflavin-dependent oxidoreductase (nitroreductase family)
MSWNENIIEEFRNNEGRVGGYFEGATVLLLHTTGRRTGREHVTPVVYLPDDDRWVVVGSKGGAPSDPDWVRNLEADPDVTIEVGTETVPGRVTKVLRGGEEWEALYSRQVERRPGFAEYLDKTEGIRTIPVIVIERREA